MTVAQILVVEDNPYDEELALHTLQSIPSIRHIHVARDGKEALDYLFSQEQPSLPSFILLDLKLPKINGVDVLKKIKTSEATKMIPIIIFSSSQLGADRKLCYQLGANSYIAKPIEFDDYVRVITQIGNYWSNYNAPVPMEATD